MATKRKNKGEGSVYRIADGKWRAKVIYKGYAKACSTSNIVLIDGEELARLMIKYDLGVSTDRVI